MVVDAVLTGEAVNAHTEARVAAYSPVRPIAITSHERKKETPNNRQTYIGFENIRASYFLDEFANIIYSETTVSSDVQGIQLALPTHHLLRTADFFFNFAGRTESSLIKVLLALNFFANF